MKAPDKIYIQQDMINNIPLEQKEFDDDVEYIRKYAILEWAKKHQCEQGFEDGEAEHGYQVAIRDLIRDIESL